MASVDGMKGVLQRVSLKRYTWVYAWHQNGRCLVGPCRYTGVEAGKIAAEAAIRRTDNMGRCLPGCKVTLLERHG